jgi:putative transposase
MKRPRFTEEQIFAVLREQEAGATTVDVCRKHGISTATFYAWKAKFGGMDVSEAKRLRALEDENAKQTDPQIDIRETCTLSNFSAVGDDICCHRAIGLRKIII